jgi:hypothetical protein
VDDALQLAVDPGLEEAVDALQEVVAVGLGVEADDAAAQQPVEDLVAPRADAEALGVGPGDVPEGEDGGAGQPLADEPGGEGEVVVLHEDDGVLGVGLLPDRLGEAGVDGDVVLPVLLAEGGAGVREVAQRPEALVGEAVVVALLLLRGEPDPAQVVGLSSGGTPTRSRLSTVSRSALPLPCATQTPEHARITGSSAVTRPLAGCWTCSWPSGRRVWMYGSRLATTTTFSPPSSALRTVLRRWGVQALGWPPPSSAISAASWATSSRTSAQHRAELRLLLAPAQDAGISCVQRLKEKRAAANVMRSMLRPRAPSTPRATLRASASRRST